MKKLEAAGGVLYRCETDCTAGFQVLLIFRNGVWDLPKGKKENGEEWIECAVREVEEEVGARGVIPEGWLTDTFHTYEIDGETVGKKTRWYSLKSTDDPEELSPQIEEGIQKLEWVSLKEASERVGYKNLIEVLRAFERNSHEKRMK